MIISIRIQNIGDIELKLMRLLMCNLEIIRHFQLSFQLK
jgi:hypothetical protein